MSDLLVVYITCDNLKQAQNIGMQLLRMRLCACVNIFSDMQSMFFWPPKSGKIDQSKEVVFIAKTIESKYQELEKEIQAIHTYDIPCIIAIPIKEVNESYYKWIKDELDE